MGFTRSIMGMLAIGYPRGYQVPTTEFINTSTAKITLSTDKKSQEIGEWLGGEHLPSALALRVRIIPKSFRSQSSAQAQYVHIGEAMAVCDVYAGYKNSQYQAVELQYCDQGAIQHQSGEKFLPVFGKIFKECKLALGKKKVLYTKFFKRQKAGFLQSGITDEYKLWPYGGYFRKGCTLDQIGQAVFAVFRNEQEKSKSDVKLSRLSTWMQKGASFSKAKSIDGKEVVMMEAFKPAEYRTLLENIKLGDVTVRLAYGKDHLNRALKCIYRSYDVETVDPITQTHTIFLKKEKNDGTGL